MDDYQAIRLIKESVGDIVQTAERRKQDDILMGLKAGTVDPDSLGDRPYERNAVKSWHEQGAAEYLQKYASMPFDQFQDVDPGKEDNPLHAHMAYSKMWGQYNQNEQVKGAAMAASTQNAVTLYKQFEAKRNQFNQLVTEGKLDLAGILGTQMVDGSVLPMKAILNQKTKMMDLYEAEPSLEGMTSDAKYIRSISLDEFGKMINNIKASQYTTGYVMSQQAIRELNDKAQYNEYFNPETGKRIHAKYLYDPENPTKGYLSTTDAKGNEIVIPSEGVLRGMGYMPLSEYEKMAKIGEIGAKTEKARAGLSKEEALAGKYRAQEGKANAETRAINEGRPYGSKAAGLKVTEKTVEDQLKVAAKSIIGPDAQIWTKADVAKDAEAEAKELEKAKEKSLDEEEFDEKGWKTKRNIRVYGVADPLNPKDPNIKHIIDDETGLRMLKFPTGKVVIVHVGEPGQAGVSAPTAREDNKKPAQKKAGLSAPASNKGQPFNPPKIKY